MYVPTKAIVLRSYRYSEADLIAKCYTESNGLKSYLIRGVLKSKKGKIKAAMFQPFSQLEVMARHKNKGTLEYIKEAKIEKINRSIRSNVKKSSIAIFLAEVIQNAVKEVEENQALYRFLENSIQWLETHEKFADFHLYFLVAFSKYLGIYPHKPQGGQVYFNSMEGHFENEETDQYSVGGTNCELLQTLMETDAEDLKTLKLNQETRQRFLVFILSYYEVQLQGFHQPKSMEVLNQLF